MRAMLIVLAVVILGCQSERAWPGYRPISGVVVNSVSGEPIEGAVVNVSMVQPGGLDGPSKVVYAEEAVTGPDGRFSLKGYKGNAYYWYFAVYKRGYACWSKNSYFDGTSGGKTKELDDMYTWQDGYTYKLQPFQQDWSYENHYHFISSAHGGIISGAKFGKEYKWELQKESEEELQRRGLKPRGMVK